MIEIGIMLGICFSCLVIGDTLYNGFKAYMQWVNDEKIAVHPCWDPILNHNYSWGQETSDFVLSGLIRVLVVLASPVIFGGLWVPIIIITAGVIGGKYHKYIVRLQKKANK